MGRGPRVATSRLWLAPSLLVGQHRFWLGEKACAVDRFGVIGAVCNPGWDRGRRTLRLAAGPMLAVVGRAHPFWRMRVRRL